MYLTHRSKFFFVTISLFSFSLLHGCMTSTRQMELQENIDRIQQKLTAMQKQLSAKNIQIENTTEAALASQNESQNLQEELKLMQGNLDEIKNRMQKIEETYSGNNNRTNTNNSQISSTNSIRQQIAHLQLLANIPISPMRKGKLPKNIHNLNDLNKVLSKYLMHNNFAQVISLSTITLQARQASSVMLASALEYRGEAKFQLQDYHGAAVDLVNASQLSDNSVKKARNLLLIGDSYIYLKNNTIAMLYYEDCIKNFPATAEAKAAIDRLKNLQGLTAHN